MVGAYSTRGTRFSMIARAVFRMHYIPVVASQEALLRGKIRVFRGGYWLQRRFYAYESTVIVPYWKVRGCGTEVLHIKLLLIGKTVQIIEIKWYRCRKFLMLAIITTFLELNVHSHRARIALCTHVPSRCCVLRSLSSGFEFHVYKPPVQAIFRTLCI